MARHQTRKTIKYGLHEDGVTAAADATGNIFSQKIHKRIIPTNDCSINRENPNRKIPTTKALVAGFNAKGHFQGTIPHGFTHGYWTQNQFPSASPIDGAGADADYVSRILMEFDLDDAGITGGDVILDASLVLFYYKSKTIKGTDEYMFDLHRFHPGRTGNTGDPESDDKFTMNATWWEYDWSGGASAATYDYFGSTGTFGWTVSGEHGDNRWDAEGLGTTGATAEHLADPGGSTAQWYDYSGGPTGSDQTAWSDHLYTYGFTASQHTVVAKQKIEFNIREAAKDALNNYNNKIRLMIKLRDDETYDGSGLTTFISVYASEAERDNRASVSDTQEAIYAPSLHITYLR